MLRPRNLAYLLLVELEGLLRWLSSCRAPRLDFGGRPFSLALLFLFEVQVKLLDGQLGLLGRRREGRLRVFHIISPRMLFRGGVLLDGRDLAQLLQRQLLRTLVSLLRFQSRLLDDLLRDELHAIARLEKLLLAFVHLLNLDLHRSAFFRVKLFRFQHRIHLV